MVYVLAIYMYDSFSLLVLKSISPQGVLKNYASIFIRRQETNCHTKWVINEIMPKKD